jgi:hypothetical protein
MFVKYIEVDEEQSIPIYLLFFFIFVPFFFLYLFFKDKFNFNFYGRRGGPCRNYEKYSYFLNFLVRIDLIRSIYYWEQFHYWSHENMRNRWRATNYVNRHHKTWRRHASMESWYLKMYLWADYIFWVRSTWVPLYYLKLELPYWARRFHYSFYTQSCFFNLNYVFFLCFLILAFLSKNYILRNIVIEKNLYFDRKFLQHFQLIFNNIVYIKYGFRFIAHWRKKKLKFYNAIS